MRMTKPEVQGPANITPTELREFVHNTRKAQGRSVVVTMNPVSREEVTHALRSDGTVGSTNTRSLNANGSTPASTVTTWTTSIKPLRSRLSVEVSAPEPIPAQYTQHQHHPQGQVDSKDASASLNSLPCIAEQHRRVAMNRPRLAPPSGTAQHLASKASAVVLSTHPLTLLAKPPPPTKRVTRDHR